MNNVNFVYDYVSVGGKNMGLFGEKFDRKEKHVIEERHVNATTGKQVADRIKGNQLARRKITQQNLYRKYRGKGMGILEARKKAKAEAASIMLRQTTHRRHHSKKHYHHSKYRHKR